MGEASPRGKRGALRQRQSQHSLVMLVDSRPPLNYEVDEFSYLGIGQTCREKPPFTAIPTCTEE